MQISSFINLWQLLKIIPIMQMIIILFVFYQSRRTSKQIYNCLDVRVFWGLPLIFHLPSILSTMFLYKDSRRGKIDFSMEDQQFYLGDFCLQCLLVILDLLSIYMYTKKKGEQSLMFQIMISISVILLLIMFEILISQYYYKTNALLFIEVNIFPLLISWYCYLSKPAY